MDILNGLNLEGQCIEICLAKPQDKKLKEKKLERQMQKQMAIKWVFFCSLEFTHRHIELEFMLKYNIV